MFYKFLSEKGVECTYFIPERIQDGYGLSSGALERLAGEFSLIITVDTGITAVEEAKLAKSLGMDMVITDHHTILTHQDHIRLILIHLEDGFKKS